MFNQGESENAALLLQNLTPVQKERLRAAVRLMINFLVDNASPNRHNEKQTKVESQKATEIQAEQLRLKLRSRRPGARAARTQKDCRRQYLILPQKLKQALCLLPLIS